jgi:ubiquinone/menaquinone biosynthesis C-methylase UbiE
MLNASSINQAGVFDVFDDISETLTAFTGWIPGFSPWTQELVRYADLESSTRLIDLGCGTGRLLAALGRREPGASFTGVDSDRDSVTIAKRRAAAGPGTFEIRNADLEALPFEDERFEVATITFVLRTVPRPTRSRILAEASRVLRPGGRIVAADWSTRGCSAARVLAGGLAMLPGLADRPQSEGTPTLAELDENGFEDAQRVSETCTLGGSVEILRAYKPVIPLAVTGPRY